MLLSYMFLNNFTLTHLKHNVSYRCNLPNVDSNWFPLCNMFMFDVISGLSSGCRLIVDTFWSKLTVFFVFGISDAFMYWLMSSLEHTDSSSLNILSILDVFLSVCVFRQNVILRHCLLPISSFCCICVVLQTECLPEEKFSQNDCISLKCSALFFFSCSFRAISVSHPPVIVFFNSSTQKSLSN